MTSYGRMTCVPRLKLTIIILYFILLLIPFYTLIIVNKANTNITDQASAYYFLQRLFGLYAITLMFTQVMLGSFMIPLKRLFGGKLLQVHIIQGLLTYGIILLHPLFNVFILSKELDLISAFLEIRPKFTTQYEIYRSFGNIGLYLVTISVFAGLLRKNKFLTHHWRKFHFLNYAAFAFVLFHSWNIGSDTHTAPFVFLYPVFITGLTISLLYRRVYQVFKQKLPISRLK